MLILTKLMKVLAAVVAVLGVLQDGTKDKAQ